MLKVDKKKKEKDVSLGTPSYSGLFSDLSFSLGHSTAESFQAASASFCCWVRCIHQSNNRQLSYEFTSWILRWWYGEEIVPAQHLTPWGVWIILTGHYLTGTLLWAFQMHFFCTPGAINSVQGISVVDISPTHDCNKCCIFHFSPFILLMFVFCLPYKP